VGKKAKEFQGQAGKNMMPVRGQNVLLRGKKKRRRQFRGRTSKFLYFQVST